MTRTYVNKAEAMGMTTVLNCSGVDRGNFLRYTESHPATYQDWSRTWDQGGGRFKSISHPRYRVGQDLKCI